MKALLPGYPKKVLLLPLCALFSFFTGVFFAECSCAIDLKGLQPLPPYGVFSTFSAEGLKKGKAGIALGIERSRQPDYYRITGSLGYGITDNIEFDVTIPYVSGWNNNTDGLEDISLGFKYRIIDEGKYGPSVAFLLAASAYTGKEQFSTDGSISGGVIVSKKVGPFSGHINAIYSRPNNSRFDDEITLATGVDFAASHNFKLLGELYGRKSYSGRLDHVEFRVGYRVMTAEGLFTTLGIGFDVKNRSPEYRLLLSLSYLFPLEKRQIKRIYEEE